MDQFEFIDPRSPEEALALLAKNGRRAQLFASGADVLYMIKDRIAGPAVQQPGILINLAGIKGLDRIEHKSGGGVVIGAMTRLSDLIKHPVLRKEYSLLVQAAERIASPQLRNTSTVAGNLCQRPRCWYFRNPDIVCLKKGGSTCWAIEGDNRWYHSIVEGGPCHIVHPSDLAPALVSLDARATLQSAHGRSEMPLGQFFVTTAQSLYKENVLSDDEMILRLTIPPVRAGIRQVFEKATIRQADEFALVSVALAAVVRGETCVECRITFGGVSPRPYRAPVGEEAMRGKKISDDAVTAAATAAFPNAQPMSMNGYKLDLAAGVLRRAFRRALAES